MRRIHQEEGGFILNSLSGDLEEGAEARFLTAETGAESSRYETSLRQKRGSLSYIHGLSLSSGKSLSSKSFCARLQEERGESRQFSQSFVLDSAKHVFQGRIFIEKAAAKAKAFQLSRNTLLGPKAKAFSSPELNVRADDVEARHGGVHLLSERQRRGAVLPSKPGHGPERGSFPLMRRGA